MAVLRGGDTILGARDGTQVSQVPIQPFTPMFSLSSSRVSLAVVGALTNLGFSGLELCPYDLRVELLTYKDVGGT